MSSSAPPCSALLDHSRLLSLLPLAGWVSDFLLVCLHPWLVASGIFGVCLLDPAVSGWWVSNCHLLLSSDIFIWFSPCLWAVTLRVKGGGRSITDFFSLPLPFFSFIHVLCC